MRQALPPSNVQCYGGDGIGIIRNPEIQGMVAATQSSGKIGRNDPCYCGSGEIQEIARSMESVGEGEGRR